MRYTVFPLLRGCRKEDFQRAVKGFSLYFVAECGSLCYLNAASFSKFANFSLPILHICRKIHSVCPTWLYRDLHAPFTWPRLRSNNNNNNEQSVWHERIPNKMEDVIKCVALFYRAGTSSKDFVRKDKFRMKVRKAGDAKEVKLREFKDLSFEAFKFALSISQVQ